MIPTYKIVTKTGAVTDYTITSDALSLYYKDVLTDGVGSFTLVLPSVNATTPVFTDIAVADTVEIYVGYDSVPATPNFVGVVGKIEGGMTDTGYLRRLSGYSQGGVLLERHKTNTYYAGVDADDIVSEWATDLGLGVGDIAADANEPTIEVKTKTYFDLLREISDYWIDAGNQIKKDFYVDVDGDLVWATRPLRTVGVETLTVGDNLLSYDVVRLRDAVRNHITVYGSADKPQPSDKDSWTETLDDWAASVGTLLLSDVPKLGAKAVGATAPVASAIITFTRTLPRMTIRTINSLQFWQRNSTTASTYKVRLLMPDTANYMEADMQGDLGWTFNQYAIGPAAVYDAVENPNGVWTATGTPNWWDIEGIQFYVEHIANNNYTTIDALYFLPDQWSDTAEDAASIAAYGQRDLEITDDKLHSDSACEQRAETLLYQLKDPPTQLTVTTPGNANLLVGDRLTITIAAEGISAQPYDVTAVENTFSAAGWSTTVTMMNSANARSTLPTSPTRKVRELARTVRSLVAKEQIY